MTKRARQKLIQETLGKVIKTLFPKTHHLIGFGGYMIGLNEGLDHHKRR